MSFLAELAALASSSSEKMRADVAAAADDVLLTHQRELAAIARQIDLAAAAVSAEDRKSVV